MPVIIWKCEKCSNPCYYFVGELNSVHPDNCLLNIEGTDNKAEWKQDIIAIIECVKQIHYTDLIK